MSILLQIDFPYPGPWGEEMSAAMRELAESIAGEPGLQWKIWTENPSTGEAGGIYLFADQASAENYLTMHCARLASFGIHDIRSKLFSINTELSLLDRAPLGVQS
jgi:hypothetical protein